MEFEIRKLNKKYMLILRDETAIYGFELTEEDLKKLRQELDKLPQLKLKK